MYIIHKARELIEDGELVDVVYDRVKKARTIQQVDNYLSSVNLDLIHYYSFDEWSLDPDEHPRQTDWIKTVAGEEWAIETGVYQ